MASTPDTIPQENGPTAAFDRHRALVLSALAAVVALVYVGALRAPFVFDDITAVTENPSLHSLGTALSPPSQATTLLGRPAVSLSLALNYALSGTQVWPYHLFNVLVHVLAALVLFGLVRRTLGSPTLAAKFGAQAGPIALTAAALWALHPLQTESVTYVVQRAESLCGLCYLAALYGLARSPSSSRPERWLLFSIAACLLGTTAKETIVTAPLAALLYDRTFLSGSFREALRRRRTYYACLALTWVPLGLLAASAGWSRGGSAGFASVSAPQYWLTQFEAVGRYLFLAIWPRHLAFDYGPYFPRPSLKLAACAVAIAAFAAGTLVSLRRRPALGFLGAWFLLALTPTCLVPVATQTIAEHRVYLALAAPATAAACLLFAGLGSRAWIAAAALCAVLGSLTAARNVDYGSAVSLWRSTARERPGNARALDNLGFALLQENHPAEAIPYLQSSVAIEPHDQGAHNNLGNALSATGRDGEARREYAAALAIQPDFLPALFDFARLADRTGDPMGAAALLRRALAASPGNPDIELALGNHLAGQPDTLAEGLSHLRAAVQLSPTAPAHLVLGEALARAGKVFESEAEYRTALALDPKFAAASYDLGALLLSAGQPEEGMRLLSDSIRENPGFSMAHFALGNALAQSGRTEEAAGEFAATIKIDPTFAEADLNWAVLLVKTGHSQEGLSHLEAAIRSRPAYAQAHFLRGVILFRTGRRDEVAAEYEALLRLQSPLAEQLVQVVRGAP